MTTHSVLWHEDYPRACRGGVVAIGNFDGVHLGHAALVARTVESARALPGPAVIVTFDPHPLTLLRPEQTTVLLTTTADRTALLHQFGADHVLVLRTTQDLLDLRAADFFEQVIRQRLAARVLVEGTNFSFGRGREGTLELLRTLCAGASLGLEVVAPIRIELAVSSSRIRSAIQRGEMREATQLLGRPYLLRGIVRTGQRRGRTIGFPTANLDGVTTAIPADGVYATRAVLEDGRIFLAATNVGGNPTFGEGGRKIEAHLLDYEGDLYGQPLALEFVERVREVRTFAGRDELVAQLGRDVERVRAAIALLPPV